MMAGTIKTIVGVVGMVYCVLCVIMDPPVTSKNIGVVGSVVISMLLWTKGRDEC